MRWFYALLCFAMLHWVFGARRGFDPHSHCNWCTSGVWFHQAIGRKSPLQSAVIHKKDLPEQVLLFYILFFDGLCDPSFMRSLHLQVCHALFNTRTKDCPPMYCFLSIRQWLDWETSQTWSNLVTGQLFFNTDHSLALAGCLVVLDDLHAHHLICVQIQALHLPLTSVVNRNNVYNVNFRQA